MDALILGAGPSGSAAAIALGSAGLRVAMVGRAPVGDRAGESLSPAAPALLGKLGVRERFLADGHLVCSASASLWGSAELVWRDSMRDPRGPSYHLDRALFERMLRERAAEAGAMVIEAEAPRVITRGGGLFAAAGEGRCPSFSARFVVDASGRAASFARSRGAVRIASWDQVALVAFARAGRPIVEAHTLIEAVPEGFWYSAPVPGGGSGPAGGPSAPTPSVPGGRFAVALFTDVASRPRDVQSPLAGAAHTLARLRAHDAVFEGPARFVGAGSVRMSACHGDGWVAVGDAAMAYDPISAHGLTLALATGIDGAEAVLACARGDRGAFERYGDKLAWAFARYEEEALRIYGSERRFPEMPYWRRRHARAAERQGQGVMG